MQIDRIVKFHKTLGDITRVRIVALLRNGPLHGQALAEKLGVSPPTITHHMTKLREVDLIYERREKNTIYFYLNEKSLNQQSEGILGIGGGGAGSASSELAQELDSQKQTVLSNFFTKEGRLKHLPAQQKKKRFVLEYLVEGLKPNTKYTEKEINEHIKQFHEDYATIRREFIMHQYMYRENEIYELNPRELWEKP